MSYLDRAPPSEPTGLFESDYEHVGCESFTDGLNSLEDALPTLTVRLQLLRHRVFHDVRFASTVQLQPRNQQLLQFVLEADRNSTYAFPDENENGSVKRIAGQLQMLT